MVCRSSPHRTSLQGSSSPHQSYEGYDAGPSVLVREHVQSWALPGKGRWAERETLGILGVPDSAEMWETLEGVGLLALSDSGPKSLDKETLGEAYSKARKKPPKPQNPAELC